MKMVQQGGKPKRRIACYLKNGVVCFFIGLLTCTALCVHGQITIHAVDAPIESVLKSVERQSAYVFFYKSNVKSVKISLDAVDAPIEKVLQYCFKGLPYAYKIVGKTIVISDEKQKTGKPEEKVFDQQRELSGRVSDSSGRPLVSVSVQVKGTRYGTMTDANGRYTLTVGPDATVLTFSFVGMEPVQISIGQKQVIDVVMNHLESAREDLVVTGFFKQNKSSFTGSVNTFTAEQLKAVAPNNLLEALTLLTPGLVATENNKLGSNPNALPDILIRGVTSFAGNSPTVNQPLIVRDGTIISLRDLYDMDINEIETVTILKDAAAAALYGAKAANGVIVIERKRLTGGKMKLIYNHNSTVEFPDFGGYHLLSPIDKLRYEQLAGLYISSDNGEQQVLDSLYNDRLMDVNRGVNTDWMRKPSRVAYSQDHSLRLSGGAVNTRYELNLRYGTVKGVMDGDLRRRYGIGFTLEYHVANGLTFTNKTNLSHTGIKYSPYGSFTTYTKMNPYDRIKDAYGAYIKVLSWNTLNPLYEASIGSFSKAKEQMLTNDLDIRWVISNKFTATSHVNFSLTGNGTQIYSSPLSGLFKDVTDPSQKGSLAITDGNGLTYSGNAVLSYNERFPDKSLLTLNMGGNFSHIDMKSYSFSGIGFYSDALHSINFASGYPSGGAPGGSQDLNADVAGFLNANYSYKSRYYFDGVYQISGSSKFGSNNRYSQFWSAGLGWNLHNESFLKNGWLDLLKLRVSTGYTGKVSFDSYQALTTYRYLASLNYLSGIGAVPITIGNPDLKWERTMNYNAGLDFSILNRRLNLTADFYIRRTNDLLIDKTIAPSAGVTSAKANLGQIENRGVEIQLDGYPIKGKNFMWMLGGNLTHNENKILKISNALKARNDANNALNTLEPLPQYQEGQSTTAIKVVRSAGIDPATGREVYIKLNGERTFIYDPADKVVVGDLQPKFLGAFYSIWTYKGVSLAAYFRYNLGQTIYNTTLATKVEGSDPKLNADYRVFNDRWKAPGDLALYKDIADQSQPYQTTRFTEKENTVALSRLNLSYELKQELLSKFGVQKASVGISMNDLFRISTVDIERGTDYLFSRGINLTLNVIF